MIDFEFLERLIAAVDNSSLDSIELERGGTRVRLSKTPEQTVTVGAAPIAAAPAAESPSSKSTVAGSGARRPGFRSGGLR